MKNLESIGKRIDDLRKARGWSKEYLARQINVSNNSVCDHIRTGRMKIDYLIKYAEVLGCSGSDLLDDEIDLSEFEISTDLSEHYPYNLALAIMGGDCPKNRQMLYRVYVPNLINALNTLPEREKKVLELRFQKGMTLRRCGKYLDVSQERIRQIEARALRRMRHPLRYRRCLMDTMDKVVEMEKENSRIRLENVKLRDKLKEMGYLSIKDTEPSEEPDWTSITVEDMELSVRSFNCLKRANINNLEDLSNMTYEEMMKVRNLGRKSIIEIMEKMKEYGVSFKDENDR